MKRNIPLYIDGNSFLNADRYKITLDLFETHQLAHETDLTGTVIQSSKPTAVFSGNDCNRFENVGYCDPFIEQVIPTTELAVDKSNISYTVDETSQTVTLNKLDYFM